MKKTQVQNQDQDPRRIPALQTRGADVTPDVLAGRGLPGEYLCTKSSSAGNSLKQVQLGWQPLGSQVQPAGTSNQVQLGWQPLAVKSSQLAPVESSPARLAVIGSQVQPAGTSRIKSSSAGSHWQSSPASWHQSNQVQLGWQPNCSQVQPAGTSQTKSSHTSQESG